MEPNEKSRSEGAFSKDTEFIQLVAKFLPPESPEFQRRAKLPREQRGPTLSQLHLEAKPDADPPQA